MRIFTTISLPDTVRSEVWRVSEQLQKLASHTGGRARRSRITWVKPEALHMTFHFFGDLDEEVLGIVKNIYQPEVAALSQVELTLSELSGLPNKDKPRTLVIEVKPLSRGLHELYKRIVKTCASEGIKIDRDKWSVHITLGRVKSHHFLVPKIRVKRLLWQVKAIDLMESRLMPRGPVYKKLMSFELRRS